MLYTTVMSDMHSEPADLKRTLAAAPGAGALWNSLTPIARRDFMSWITSAKQEETRMRRIARVPDMLKSGKRRPCCYALVPMSVYTALGKNQKAKKQWDNLTPDERRDFVGWINAAGESEEYGGRIGKACDMLARGVRAPSR